MDNYFMRAGDLDTNEQERKPLIQQFDFDKINKNMSDEQIKMYLQTIVSGKKYDMECELGTICSEGVCIISFEELLEMIEEGSYNLIDANYFNKEMIEIKYQQFSKDFSRKM